MSLPSVGQPVEALRGPHGGDGESVARELGLDPTSLLDLSASLNPLAPDVAAILRRTGDRCVSTYPDARSATAAFAATVGVDPDQLLLTNGGAEAIALVAAQHPVGSVPEPAFSLYRRHLREADDSAPEAMVWRANPSSPQGVLAAAEDTAAVWDEAFWPLATGTWTRGDEDAYRLGSLTKLWACPGLRLGYVIAPTPDQRQVLEQRQPRWAVNGLALAALPELLAHSDLPGWRCGIASLRRELAALWRAHDFVVHEAAANWVLVDDAAPLRIELARCGVLVRDCGSFGLPGVVRVAVPDAAGLDRLERALSGLRS